MRNKKGIGKKASDRMLKQNISDKDYAGNM